MCTDMFTAVTVCIHLKPVKFFLGLIIYPTVNQESFMLVNFFFIQEVLHVHP